MSMQSSLEEFAGDRGGDDPSDVAEDGGESDETARDRPDWPSFRISDNRCDTADIPEPLFTAEDVAEDGSPVSEDCPDWVNYTADDRDAGIEDIWSVLQIWGDDYAEILRDDELADCDATSETPYGRNQGEIR